mmetsp:Transcript_38963/g.115775  ORF Transcript_38963/g.115775 Transcript_38963/m.115775 type:complete len:230 (+) Transcript_38963:335-1024(+)
MQLTGSLTTKSTSISGRRMRSLTPLSSSSSSSPANCEKTARAIDACGVPLGKRPSSRSRWKSRSSLSATSSAKCRKGARSATKTNSTNMADSTASSAKKPMVGLDQFGPPCSQVIHSSCETRTDANPSGSSSYVRHSISCQSTGSPCHSSVPLVTCRYPTLPPSRSIASMICEVTAAAAMWARSPFISSCVQLSSCTFTRMRARLGHSTPIVNARSRKGGIKNMMYDCI